jgi:hypothetical protein
MSHATALSIMSLHRKQMADALTRKGREDMLGFHYAAFRHRQLMKVYAPTMYALWAKQSPQTAAQDANAMTVLRIFVGDLPAVAAITLFISTVVIWSAIICGA